MKLASSKCKTTQPSQSTARHGDSVGPNGLSQEPPGYGVEFADRMLPKASIRRQGKSLALPPARSPFARDGSAGSQQSSGFRSKLAAGIRAAGTGQPLPEGERRSLEDSSGVDFSDVRVFDNPAAHHTADLLNARAFSVGRSIYFGRDEYRPTTAAGRELLAHEAAHTIQQRGAPMPALEQLSVGKPDSAEERDADAFAQVFRRVRPVETPSPAADHGLGSRDATPVIRSKPATRGARIMRTPRVDRRMPSDLQGSARYVFPGGELGVAHEVAPIGGSPTRSEGHPTLEYDHHDVGWTEFRSGVDADYDGWGTFIDVQYMQYPTREATERFTHSNLQYWARIHTSAVGFTDDAAVNEDWVLGATNIYYKKQNVARNNEVLEHGIMRTWFVVEGEKSYSIGDAITAIGVVGSVASIVALFLR